MKVLLALPGDCHLLVFSGTSQILTASCYNTEHSEPGVVPGISKWEIPEKNNFEWHHGFYRYWLTSNGTIYNMHTFPKVPWFKTVIGFEDDASRAFLLKFLIAVYQVENGG